MFSKATNYFKQSYQEMKKVAWPTKTETTKHTLLVIGISLGVAAFLGAFDYLFSELLRIIVG